MWFGYNKTLTYQEAKGDVFSVVCGLLPASVFVSVNKGGHQCLNTYVYMTVVSLNVTVRILLLCFCDSEDEHLCRTIEV